MSIHYTIQEAFDIMAKHLLTQQERSRSIHSGACLYRNGKMKCAIGALIPDELYDPVVEHILAPHALRKLGIFIDGDGASQFTIEMQALHDRTDPADWPNHLKHVAEHYHLEFSL